MKLKTIQNSLIIFFMGSSCILAMLFFFGQKKKDQTDMDAYSAASAAVSRALSGDDEVAIRESARLEDSDSASFWLNSGGLYYQDREYGHTILGELPAYARWRVIYSTTNPVDTDKGYHPQNIFRLITKEKILDVSQQFYFLVNKDNISQSPNRNESNGVFVISRYLDGDNLYYAGVRVDGTAVIKKKVNGIYHTLAQVPFFEGDPYDKNIHPSLIPKNQWIGLRADVETISSDTVKIKLFVDLHDTGTWKKILEAHDIASPNIPAILSEGHGGIRSDFMDIRFKNQKVLAI